MAGLLDPSKWVHDDKPVHVPASEECRQQYEEQRAYEREVQELIDEAMAGRQAAHLAGERKLNEEEVERVVDRFFADSLLSIKEKAVPPERTRNKHIKVFREFSDFCREQNLTSLPARGPTMFWWLVGDCKPELVKQRANALRFVHEISKEFCDETYLVAAEKWARTAKSHQSTGSNGAANPEGTEQ